MTAEEIGYTIGAAVGAVLPLVLFVYLVVLARRLEKHSRATAAGVAKLVKVTKRSSVPRRDDDAID